MQRTGNAVACSSQLVSESIRAEKEGVERLFLFSLSKCPTLWRLRATHYTLWHVVTENSQSVLSKFIISCCAAFIAILGRIWPAGHRLDPTGLIGLLSCANSSFMHWFINWFHTYWLLVVYVLALGIQGWMAQSVGIKWLWDPLGPGRIQWRWRVSLEF